jgi:hypothetical protein
MVLNIGAGLLARLRDGEAYPSMDGLLNWKDALCASHHFPVLFLLQTHLRQRRSASY